MKTAKNCPKCGFASNTNFADCPKCGVIVSKYLERKRDDKVSEKREVTAKNSSLQNLAGANALIIKQQKELGEILTGFETKNKITKSEAFEWIPAPGFTFMG